MSTPTTILPAARDAQPSRPPAHVVAVAGLEFAYGDRKALDQFTLGVPAGAIFGLLGPNGSGKSTLLSVLIGRRAPDAGAVRLFGEALSSGLRRRIGMVLQGPSLDPLMSVRETMLLQARLFGLARADAVRESQRLLATVGLADRAKVQTRTLSGGLKRRLELARALLPGPDLLLLDEPTLALDPDSRQALWTYLLEANAAGCTLLLATNDVAEAERHCHEVALVDAGRVVTVGTPAALKAGLRHDAVRVDWRREPSAEAALIEGWPGVGHVRLAGRTTHVTVDAASAFLARLFQQAGDAIAAVRIEESTLEDVYFQVVGKPIAPATSEAS